MKTTVALVLVVGAAWLATIGLAQNSESPPKPPPGAAQPAAAKSAEAPAAAEAKPTAPAATDQKIMHISLEDPPLDIIRALIEQTQLKIELDPRVENGIDAAGNPIPNWKDPVSVRWDNVSALEALNDFLPKFGLVLVQNGQPQTWRITHKSAVPKTTAPAPAPPAEAPAAKTTTTAETQPAAAQPTGDEPGDWNFADETPLEVINNLAKALAKSGTLNVMVDPRVASGIDPDNKSVPFMTNNVSPIGWKGITARQALELFVGGYNMQLVIDPETKGGRITWKPTTEPRLARVFQLHFANPTNIVNVLSNSFTGVKSLADLRTSQVLVMATEKEMLTISNLLVRLDGPVRQILIAAQFWETTKNPTSIKGIDWTGTMAQQNVVFGNGLISGQTFNSSPGGPPTSVTLPSGRTVTSIPGAASSSIFTNTFGGVFGGSPGLSALTSGGFTPSTAILSADGVRLAMSFLNTDADTESIATPRAVALDGQPTELSVVRNVPVFEQQQGTLTQAGVQPNTVKPNYQVVVPGTPKPLNEIGITLMVTPRVVGDSRVFLDLKPEISSIEPAPARNVLGGQVNEAPIFSRRKVTTQAVVPSGDTLVLGGLVSDLKSKASTKVPLLGDLPLLGLAFRKDDKSRTKSNLLIFVTPTVLEEADFQNVQDPHRFMQKPMRSDDLGPDESAWDSGAPYDWKSGLGPYNQNK